MSLEIGAGDTSGLGSAPRRRAGCSRRSGREWPGARWAAFFPVPLIFFSCLLVPAECPLSPRAILRSIVGRAIAWAFSVPRAQSRSAGREGEGERSRPPTRGGGPSLPASARSPKRVCSRRAQGAVRARWRRWARCAPGRKAPSGCGGGGGELALRCPAEHGHSLGGSAAARCKAAEAVADEPALCLQCDMNDCYSRLRRLVPTIPPNKKVSKVELLQHVIDYIRSAAGAGDALRLCWGSCRCLRRRTSWPGPARLRRRGPRSPRSTPTRPARWTSRATAFSAAEPRVPGVRPPELGFTGALEREGERAEVREKANRRKEKCNKRSANFRNVSFGYLQETGKKIKLFIFC